MESIHVTTNAPATCCGFHHMYLTRLPCFFFDVQSIDKTKALFGSRKTPGKMLFLSG